MWFGSGFWANLRVRRRFRVMVRSRVPIRVRVRIRIQLKAWDEVRVKSGVGYLKGGVLGRYFPMEGR